MVESGSTTNYQGNGYPFPNWLVYNSSLFEVKVNGRPARFMAPEPIFSQDSSGWFNYSNLNMAQESNPRFIKPLLVNLTDGVPGPYPELDKTMYLNTDMVEEPMLMSEENVLDPAKPLWLHSLDFSKLSGKNQLDYNLYDFPYIECDELKLTLIFDPGSRAWKIHSGLNQQTLMLEWRFKQLYELGNSPVFLEINNIYSSEAYINIAANLNPLVSLIPNEQDSTLLEVHARTVIDHIVNTVFPRYSGVPLLAWPDMYKSFLENKYRPEDSVQIMLPVSKGINITNSIWRINNEPAWILENTLPDDYECNNINPFYWSTENSGDYEVSVIETDGFIKITDGTNIIKYIGRTGVWVIENAVNDWLVLEGMFIATDILPYFNASIYFNDRHKTYNGDNYGYFGFALFNPLLNNIVPVSFEHPSYAEKYLNHEYVVYDKPIFNISPNFEVYGFENYKLLINGELVAPTNINMGVNDVVLSARYEVPNLDVSFEYNLSNLSIDFNFNHDLHSAVATAPEGFTYYLDGKREDLLERNIETSFFNRCIPFVLQWNFIGEVGYVDTVPLFVKMEHGEVTYLNYDQNRSNGIYLNYQYSNTGKSASLTFAPCINNTEAIKYNSLAMVHERDLIRGWKKSGYTGRGSYIYDTIIGKDRIGFPIVIREEEDVDNGADTVISPLPITFTAEELGGVGTFDIIINGQKIASNISADQIEQAFIDTEKLIVEDTGEEVPNTLLTPHVTGEMELDGIFDVYIDGELVLEDVTADDLVVATEIDEVTSITAEYVKAPEPPEPEAM